VRIRTGVPVADFEVADGSVRALITDTGERAAVSAVVLCPGADAEPLAAALGLELPMRHAPGLLVYTTPAAVDCGLTITSRMVNLRPDRHGRHCLQAIDLDDHATSTSDVDPVAEEVLSRAHRVLPGLRHARVEEWRFGQRPIPADGLPVVGRIPTTTNAYIAVSHSGITLGPLLGRLIAAEVCLGRVDPRLTGFRPERLRHNAAPTTSGEHAS
jgi:glycine/D-amino acid oxidase-like deaminating enzyme